MFPAQIAGFSFHGDAAGTDASLAARLSAVCPHGPVIALGATRPNLLVALARLGVATIALDPSRRALAAAKAVVTEAGFGDRVSLIVADPRDAIVPGGAQAALIPSLVLRALLTEQERAEMMQCLARIVGPEGSVCVDLERLPAWPDGESEQRLLRREPEGSWHWSNDAASGRVSLTWRQAGAADMEIVLAGISIADSLAELGRAGLVVAKACDAATGGEVGPDTERAWIVARPSRRR